MPGACVQNSIPCRVVNRKSVNRSLVKTDDRLPLFITDDRKWPTTHCRSHSVAPEAAVKCHSIVCVINITAACLGLSHMHARTLSRVREYLSHGEGQIFVPHSVTVAYGSEAQLYEIKECMIVHFAAADATLIAYPPPTACTSAGARGRCAPA